MNDDEIGKVRRVIERLREEAGHKCGCKRIEKVLESTDLTSITNYYMPCCPICCDCTIDSYEEEWE